MSQDVFILGAGFSKAISKQMPTLAELSEALWPEVKSLFPEGQEPPEELAGDIEALLSYLSQDYPWLTEAHNLKNRAAFLEISTYISNGISNQHKKIFNKDFPQWLNEIVTYWHENKTDVITFNYDIIIEQVATKIKAPTFYGPSQAGSTELNEEDIYPVTITPAMLRQTGDILSGGKHDTFKFYKMHGSVNWFYSGSPEYYGEPIYLAAFEERHQPYLMDKVPLIVPPALDKTVYFRNEMIRRIWSLSGTAIGTAKRIFCLGYSFPITDMMVRYFTLTNQSDNEVEFYWVNIKKPHEGLTKMLPRTYTINDRYVQNDAICVFVDDYVKGNL